MRSPFYWLLGLSLALMLTIVPFIYYRWEYTHSKRLRVVTENKVYRSGQMTASGFAEAVERYQIRTIINLQDEFPDPDIALGYFDRKTIKESELCRQLGVRYVFLGPDLISRKRIPHDRPPAIDKFLTLMDDRATYPVLLHCRLAPPPTITSLSTSPSSNPAFATTRHLLPQTRFETTSGISGFTINNGPWIFIYRISDFDLLAEWTGHEGGGNKECRKAGRAHS